MVKCSLIKFSLRTSTYFWAFMNVFLGIVFLFTTALETYQFNHRDEEQGIWIYISTPVSTRQADVFILWCYGLLYFACGVMMFHGIHKEITTLIQGVLVIFIILEICAVGFIKRLINYKYEPSQDQDDPGFFHLYFITLQISLVIFFLSVQVFVSVVYAINLSLYVFALRRSKAILNHRQNQVQDKEDANCSGQEQKSETAEANQVSSNA